MSDADLWAAWRLWMFAGGGVVLVVAALLVVIWTSARRTYLEAVRAMSAVLAIRRQTHQVWSLTNTNDLTRGVLRTLQDIEAKSAALAALARARR